ncbi:MAG: SMC-Scp complex subunit ScpB [Azospirillaceae bacterium]
MSDRGEDERIEAALDFAGQLRLVEAMLFASAEPLGEEVLRTRLPEKADLAALLSRLSQDYAGRGVNLVHAGNGWAFRSAPDLAPHLRRTMPTPRKLSRAALETLAIIAYHQPVTRSEIEGIRGVTTSRGTIDTLMEAGWVRPGRRRQTPGRPVTWMTTGEFLDHFQLGSIEELPGVEELKAAGLLDSRPAIATLPGGRLGEDEESDAWDDREADDADGDLFGRDGDEA